MSSIGNSAALFRCQQTFVPVSLPHLLLSHSFLLFEVSTSEKKMRLRINFVLRSKPENGKTKEVINVNTGTKEVINVNTGIYFLFNFNSIIFILKFYLKYLFIIFLI
jgi:hypothetical protein